MAADPIYFTTNSALALSSVPVLCTLAYQSSKVFLPKHTSRQDRYTFIWMVSYFHLYFIRFFCDPSAVLNGTILGFQRIVSRRLRSTLALLFYFWQTNHYKQWTVCCTLYVEHGSYL